MTGSSRLGASAAVRQPLTAPEQQLQLVSAAGDGGPVAVGDALVPAGAGRTGVVVGRAIKAVVELVTVGRVGEPAVQRRTRDCGEGGAEVRARFHQIQVSGYNAMS